jgi:hypothetical protein
MSKNKSKWNSDVPQAPKWPDYTCTHLAEKMLRVEGEDLQYTAGRRGFKIMTDEEHRYMMEAPELPSFTAYKKDWSALCSMTMLCDECRGFFKLANMSPSQLTAYFEQREPDAVDQAVQQFEELIAA